MALDKLVDSTQLDSALSFTADAIREKTGEVAPITWDMDTGFAQAIEGITGGIDTSDADATSSDILDGKTAYVNGEKVEGNIPTKTGSNLSASGKTVTVPAGYYAQQYTKDVATGSASTPATTVTANPSISVNSSGLITATASTTKSVTPTVSAGYVSSGTAGTITVSGSNTSQLSTQSGATITPTESEQTAVAAGKYTTGAVKVGAISSTYVGSAIAQNDSDDLTVSGATVTALAGYYAENATKTIASGSVVQNVPTVNSSTGIVTATSTVTEGYVTQGTPSNVLQLDTVAETTYHPVSADKTISTPADVMTISDGIEDLPVKQITFGIEPVQDLHGYDHPWPAGGGKNKYSGDSISVGGTNQRTKTITIETIPAGSYYLSFTTTGNATTYGIQLLSSEGTPLANFSAPGSFTVSSDIAKAYVYISQADYDGGKTLTMQNIQIEAGSTASTFAPYSNICPISGWTGANVYDDPKYGGMVAWNQLCVKPTRDSGTLANMTYTKNTDGSFTIDGTANATDYYTICTNSTTPIVGHKYLLTGCSKDGTGTYGLGLGNNLDDTGNGAIVNFPASGRTNINLCFKFAVGASFSNVKFVPQIFDLTAMFGSTVADDIYAMEQATAGSGVAWFRNLFPKDYYEYNAGETTTVSAVNGDPYRHIAVSFPSSAGTVYGGTLTVNNDGSGELVVDRANIDLGTLSWTKENGLKRFYAAIPDAETTAGNVAFNGISLMYKAIQFNNMANMEDGVMALSTGRNISVRNLGLIDNTESEFKTAMSGVQLVYELATPVTYSLTPGQVKTLLGVNNIWASTGQVLSMTYASSEPDAIINQGLYTTGVQKMDKIIVSNVDANNIRYGKTVSIGSGENASSIASVSGTFTEASTVSSGQTAATAAQIRDGYSAWVDGAEVQGSLGNTFVTQSESTISGATLTPGTASWGNGVISAGTIEAASFANTATSGQTYKDISGTTAAPVLISGSNLFINKGVVTDNLKISLAKLVPDGASAELGAGHILSGYSAYNNDGTLIAGNIPTKTALTVNGKTVTAPSGYYASDTSASVALGTVTSGTASITSLTKTYNSTSGKFDITGSANVSAPTVGTAGYVSSSEGTKNAKTGGATVSSTIDKIVGSTAITGTTTKKPSIGKVATPTGVTNAASGDATTTAPSSGVYVAVKSNANTGTLTATPSVTTAGYGDATNHGITANTATVGAQASDTTYIPITTTSASVSGKTVSYGTGWITEGSKSVADGTVVASVSSNTGGSASMSATGFTAASNATDYYVTLSTSAGSVKAKATGGTSGYVTSSTTNETAATSVAVSGNGNKLYVPAGGVTTSLSADGMGTYFNAGTSSDKNVTLTPKYTNTAGYIAAHSTATNNGGTAYYKIKTTSASVSGGTVSYGTGWITEGSKTVSSGTITNNTTLPSGSTSSGTVNRGSYIKIGAGYYGSDAYYYAQNVSNGTITNNTTLPSGSSSSGTVNRGSYIKIGAGYYSADKYYYAQANSGTKTITGSGETDVNGYAKASVAAVSGSIGGSASGGSATAAISNVNSMNTISDVSGKTAGTDYWAVKATATGSAGSYTPKYTVSTAGWIGSTVTGTAQSVSVSSDSTGKSIYIPKATFDKSGATVYCKTAGYIPAGSASSGVGTIGNGTVVASVSSNSGGSASMAATGFTASSSATNYYVTLTTSAGSVKAKAVGGTSGYVTSSTTNETAATSVAVSGNNTKLYIPAGSVTNNTSGGTSSGTINMGSQIKIGAGYYPSDLYYTAKDRVFTYDSTNKKLTIAY